MITTVIMMMDVVESMEILQNLKCFNSCDDGYGDVIFSGHWWASVTQLKSWGRGSGIGNCHLYCDGGASKLYQNKRQTARDNRNHQHHHHCVIIDVIIIIIITELPRT